MIYSLGRKLRTKSIGVSIEVCRIISYFCNMAIVLFDNSSRNSLFPLTFTKAVAALRFGILSIQERWAMKTKEEVFIKTDSYLQVLYPAPNVQEHLWIDAAVMADDNLFSMICNLENGACIVDEKGLVAGRLAIPFEEFKADITLFAAQKKVENVKRLTYCWDMMLWNDSMIREDFKLVTKGRASQPISPTVQVVQTADIFIEEGAKLEFCTLNSKTGPIYIGKDAEIMEGSCVRGPFSIGFNSVLKMNSRIYGATSLGPCCMGGGEIKNSVIMGYTNKAHDGYLGDAVIGEWCNIGAGATNSNVKNTAGDVKVWNYASNSYIGVGQKCGLIMGDYSRVAINSSINTGTVVGVSCNVFGAGLLPTIFNNFCWGVTGNKYDLNKAFFAIDNWKKMKNSSITEAESSVLTSIFAQIQ
jgi:UDP-N-acetylglucosamine diphosphorylase/glucosamine-1-phosphate N-acetyltransferase